MSTNPSVVKTAFAAPGRNVYSLSHKEQFDTKMGIVRAFAHVDLNPFERLEVVPSALVKTLPALAPIMSRARCRIFAFWSPDKNYVKDYLTNNIEDNNYLPSLSLMPEPIYEAIGGSVDDKSFNEYAVQPNSLANAIGMPLGFSPLRFNNGRRVDISMHRVLTYWDVMRNYFVDRNYKDCYSEVGISDSSLSLPVRYQPTRLSVLDEYFGDKPWCVDSDSPATVYHFDNVFQNDEGDNLALAYMWERICNGGLMLKPYMPDVNSAFSSTAKYEEAIAKSLVRLTSDVAGQEGVTVQSIIDGAQTYNFANKILATGGQLDEMIRAEFGVNVTDDLDIPMFIRQWSFDLGFNDVVSQSATTDEPLGTLAGRGVGGLSFGGDDKESKKRRRKNTLSFRSKFHGTMCFYFVIEPYVEYSDGFDPMLLKVRALDKFWPSYDRAGWQPLLLSNLVANHNGDGGDIFLGGPQRYGSVDPFINQVGVQPAYTEYKGAVSRNSGNIAGNLRFWTFSRNFSNFNADVNDEEASTPFTPYIIPEYYNYAFADTEANPFVCSIGLDIKVKRPISRVQLNTSIV